MHCMCARRAVFLAAPAAAGNLSTVYAGSMCRSVFLADIWAHLDHSFSIFDWSQNLLKGFFLNLGKLKASSRWPLLALTADSPWGCCLQLFKGTEVPLPFLLWGAGVLSLPPHLQGICSRRAWHFWIFGGEESSTERFHNTFPFPCFKIYFFLPFCEMAVLHPFLEPVSEISMK